MHTTTPRVIAYRRVSTDEQAVSGAGLDAQTAAITAAVSGRGWAPLVGVLTDEGVSGKVAPDRRPALAEALALLDAARADVLVVAKLDRLTRSVGDLVALLDRAERGRWSLVVLDADVDTTTASGRLAASVLRSVAEWERRVIGERTKAALAARKAAGKRLSRPVEVPEHVRARIVAEHAAGASLAGITRLLDAERVRTARAGRWHASTVRRVLESVQLDALALAAA